MFWRNGNASGMAYEEASVAGETPDRSKQRKSSGKPTGAEPSVPAPEERDPRLAVAREVPAAREESPAKESPASEEQRQDRATAVFSTKAVAEAAASGTAGSGDSKGSAESEGSEGSAEGSASAEGEPKGAEKGDARLRAAVAAWVASADEEAPEAADAGKPAEKAAATGEESSSEEGSSGAGAASDASAASGDSDEAGDAGDPKSEATASGVAAAAAGARKDSPDAEAPADGKAETDPSEEDVAGAGESGSDASAASGDSSDSGDSDEAGDADDLKSEATASGVAATAAAAAAQGADGDEKDSPDAEPGAAADASEGSSDDADETREADAADSDADADEKAGSKAEGEPKAKAKAPEHPSGGVDQATAVFKALPPKAVDQPTTMLKIGDHKPGAKKPEDKPAAKPEAKPEAKPSAKPEGAAERTSKFVALKPLDNAPSSGALPPAKAAAPAAGATAAGATAPEKEKAAEPGSVGPERTTQQPLPPRPALDLLAELTNTPPPPETPVRTAVRRVKIWTPLVLLMVVVFAVVQAVRPLPTPTLTLTAKETVTFEGGKPSMPWPSKGQAAMDVNGIGTFGTSGDQKPVPIASIAKVMTVYLVLRDHPLKPGNNGPDIPVDAAAEKHYETGKAGNESVVKVSEGQKIKQYEALQAVMLPSANNIAKLLARWDTKSDSEDEFVAKMNKTAKELGMKNTHYTDPSGLDKTTVSTAEDLVKLGRAAMEDPVFNEISRQPSYKDLNGDKQNNFFGLVPTVAIGIKTGTTTAAGGNILFAAEKKVGGETRTIIGAALGQYGQDGVANIDQVTGVTRKLIEAGQGALTAKTIVKKGDVVGEVDDGLGGTTPVVATKDVSAAGWSGLTVKLKLGEDGGETIPHSAKAGTKVGVLSVGDGKDGAVEVPVALQKDLAEPGFGAKLQRVG
ncbi:D-alanyl-D-alanine carboxypeptidase [Streptomyces sp. NPDC088360]|uniref:D-alanyl-D-alanine carboxypeptidase n=1 Tax=Streptomyces sp. NPDC088360 TaxID=3154515 RepID=UPI00344BC6E2